MSGQRLIRIDQWLAQVFGDAPPSRRTVWRWIDAGRIYPAPQKYGGKRTNIYLDADGRATAERIGNGNVSDGIRIALAMAKDKL